MQSVFGYPNDEAYSHDPRGPAGDRPGYGFFEVLDSTWPDRLIDDNRHAFPDSTPSHYAAMRHHFIGCHDASGEFLAQGMKIRLTGGSYEEAAREACERIARLPPPFRRDPHRADRRPFGLCRELPVAWRRPDYSVRMADAAAYRIWPPVALGVPLLAGLSITAGLGDPFALPVRTSRVVATVLIVAFALWNGSALWLMARHRTALLPGGSTRTILDRGPFGVSRNPLYLGLIALDVALALLWPSFWALALAPIGVVALWWGAILPEERYLSAKFGAEFDAYRARVRRWL